MDTIRRVALKCSFWFRSDAAYWLKSKGAIRGMIAIAHERLQLQAGPHLVQATWRTRANCCNRQFMDCPHRMRAGGDTATAPRLSPPSPCVGQATRPQLR